MQAAGGRCGLHAALPDEDLLAVLPPPSADLCAGEGGQALHIRTLELLYQARSQLDISAEAASMALVGLARYQPLLPSRITASAISAASPIFCTPSSSGHTTMS